MVEIEQETGNQLHALIIHNDCAIDAFLWLQEPFITHSKICFCMRENAKRQKDMLFRVSYRSFCLWGGEGGK